MLSHSTPNADVLPPLQTNEFLPPIGNWVVFGGLSIVFTLGLAIPLSSIVKYKEIVKAEASIRPAGEVHTIQPAIDGQIETILAKENQVIRKGEILATIKSDQFKVKRDQLKKNIQQLQQQQIQVSAQSFALDHQINAEKTRIGRSVASAKAELSYQHRNYRDKNITSTAALEEAKANLRSEQATLNSVKARQERYLEVAAALSKNELEEAQLAVEQQQQKVEAARAKVQTTIAGISPSNAEVAIAQEKIAQENAIGRASLAKLMQERQAIGQQRLEIDKQLHQNLAELKQIRFNIKQTNITATANGIITELNLRNPGQSIRPGEEIAQIAPSNVASEVKTAVSPQDISKVKIGQLVSMRISACPYPDYGTLQGTVSQISEDTIKRKQNSSNNSSTNQSDQASPAFYKVTIKPKNLSLVQGKNKCTIELGMEGRADIITREETVLRFILRKARLVTNI